MDTLIDQSTKTWNQVLQKPSRTWRQGAVDAFGTEIPPAMADVLAGFSYSKHIDFSKDVVELGTDDFVNLSMDFAEQIGINLEQYANHLAPPTRASEYTVGIALRTVLEVEGLYIEHPYAHTVYRVPKQFLIIFGAALIGIATAKLSELDPIIAGSVSGVGSLLINILSERYLNGGEPDVDWLEEFVLRVLEQYGIQSFDELQATTHIDPDLLKKVLGDLKNKQLVDEHKSWIDKTNLKYDLSGRHN